MPVTPKDISEAADRGAAAMKRQTLEQKFAEGQIVEPYSSELARDEYRALSSRCGLNLIGTNTDGLSRDVSPTGYVAPGGGVTPDPWLARQRLGVPEKSRQARRWAFIDGESYVAVVPMPGAWQVRVYEASAVTAVWDDPINDMAPISFIAVLSWERGEPLRMVAWEREALTIWERATDRSWQILNGSTAATTMFGGDIPVVHYVAGEWSKRGGVWSPRGEVNPLLSPQRRVTQSIFDLLLVQQFGAVAIRTIAGLELPENEDDAEAYAIKVAANRILVSEDVDTKFGSLAPTPLDPFINSVSSAIQHFSIVASLSPTRTAGKIENVSAEAISSARQAEEDIRQAYRERWTDAELKLTRLSMIAAGMGDPGEGGEIMWRETEVRSLSQIADAALKFVQAEIPVRPLIARSLGWSNFEVGQVQAAMAVNADERAGSAAQIIADRQARAREAMSAIGQRRAA